MPCGHNGSDSTVKGNGDGRGRIESGCTVEVLRTAAAVVGGQIGHELGKAGALALAPVSSQKAEAGSFTTALRGLVEEALAVGHSGNLN